MSSEDKEEHKKLKKIFYFKKQTLYGKIILIGSIFIFGIAIIIVFFSIIFSKWQSIGIYSVWGLFGWLFFAVLLYISINLVSMLIQKERENDLKEDQIQNDR